MRTIPVVLLEYTPSRWGIAGLKGSRTFRTRRDAVRYAARIAKAADQLAREVRASLETNVIGG
jgi:hypothetical protein